MATTVRQYYLGRVRRVPQRADAYHFASVEPLIESDPTGTRWIGPVRDAKERFPKRGWVHWHDAPVALQLGSWWQFAIDEHPAAERGDRPELFQLEDPQEAVEVLDLRGWSDNAALRSAFTGEGIPLTPPPAARRILLWLASGECVGPLLLKAGAQPGLWALDAPEVHRDAARMPTCRLPETAINAAPIDGGRWFVSPALDLGRGTGFQNWTSDTQVARSVLARLRKMDPDFVKAIGVTDHLFREYLERVEGGRVGITDPAVERARADRLRGVREAIQRDATLLAESAEALLETDAVRGEVDRRVRTRVDDEVRARRSEIEAALPGIADELSNVQTVLDVARTELAAVNAELAEKRQELETTVSTFEREVTTRLERIARRPEALFAEAVVVRAVLAELSRSGANSGPDGHSKLGPSRESAKGRRATEVLEANVILDGEAAVRAALALHASAGAFSLHAMIGLHAMFVAGTTPVVVGSRGYDLLRAYACAVAGNRLHWIPVTSSTMEPSDLLGRFDIASRQIVPAASGLLDVVHDATVSGKLHVVVLEGFNRAPSESYLAPILEAIEACRLGDASRAIPLAHPSIVAADDPYHRFARLTWPPSLLVACLPTDGSATLPVSAAVWRHLALLDADDRHRSITAGFSVANGQASISEIPPILWPPSRTPVVVGSAPEAASGWATAPLAHAMSLTDRDLSDATRLHQALCAMGLAASDAAGVAVAATLVARSAGDRKAIEDALRSQSIHAPGWHTAWTEADRLRT